VIPLILTNDNLSDLDDLWNASYQME
jgi:hypothetical protein